MPDDSVRSQIDLAMSLLTAHIRRHRGTADTFDGIARWWLGAESAAISAPALRLALLRLVEAGVLSTRRLPGGELLWYSLAPAADAPAGQDSGD